MKIHEPDFKALLNKIGHKATSGRILLLRTLWEESKPISVDDLQKRMKGKSDKVTLYRSLESFVKSGVVRSLDFRHGHIYYELDVLRDHHHHIVCTICGSVEDVKVCDSENLEKSVLTKSRKFRVIKSHALEFFGECTNCFKV